MGARYCYLDPHFPKSTYFAFCFIQLENAGLMLHPFVNLHNDYREFIDDLIKFHKTNDRKDIAVIPAFVAIPVTLIKLIPLDKSYWREGKENFNALERSRSFFPAIDKPEFYNVLATAHTYEGKIYFNPQTCFKKGAEDKEIESFMMLSDAYVDIRTKYAALYSFGQPFRYELDTDTVVPIDHRERTEESMPN